MGLVFILIGSLGGAVFGIIALVADMRSKNGGVTREFVAVAIGFFACAVLTWVGSKLEDDEADRLQSERHTALLTSIAKEAQRLSADDIRVLVTWTAEEYVEIPDVLDGRWEATLYVAPEPNELPADVNQWSWRSLIKPTMTLTASETHVLPRQVERPYPLGLDGPNYSGEAKLQTFRQFVGDLSSMVHSSSWNGAIVEFHLAAPNGYSDLFTLANDHEIVMQKTSTQWPRKYSVPSIVSYTSGPSGLVKNEPKSESDRQVTFAENYEYLELPIEAQAEVFVGTRRVASLKGVLTAAAKKEHHATGSAAVVKFAPCKLPANLFEQWDTASKMESSARRKHLGLFFTGWVFTSLALAALVAWGVSAAAKGSTT